MRMREMSGKSHSDDTNGAVCGHIIARRSRHTSFAYTWPAQTIFDDIKRAVGAKDVRLWHEGGGGPGIGPEPTCGVFQSPGESISGSTHVSKKGRTASKKKNPPWEPGFLDVKKFAHKIFIQYLPRILCRPRYGKS